MERPVKEETRNFTFKYRLVELKTSQGTQVFRVTRLQGSQLSW